MLIAQITDMHVKEEGCRAFGLVDTATRLATCVARLAALDPAPDVVVATGDLVDEGTDAEYAHLRHLLSPLSAPVYLIPGNHDDREAIRRVFGDWGYLPSPGFLHYTVEHFPVRIVALDTVIPGEPGGRMCPERLTWLEARLAEAPHRPTIVLMHHPPFETGIVHMDSMRCEGAGELARVIAKNPQVERILCGHVHRPVQVRFAGTIASIAPSTAFQVALDLRPGSLARWTEEPAAFQLHAFEEGRAIASHTAYVDVDVTPRPFHAEE
jgi:3',5'-cyclic AMP phosphodiesterase CpdA